MSLGRCIKCNILFLYRLLQISSIISPSPSSPSHLTLPVLAIAATAPRCTLLSILKAFAVFFQASTFHAIASRLILFRGSLPALPNFTIFASEAGALFATSLAGSIAFAVLSFAAGLDAAASYFAYGRHLVQEVEDLSLS